MFRNLVRIAATPTALAALLALCTSANGASSNNSKSIQKTIYVANSCTNEVTAYPIGSSGNVSPLRPQVALGPPTGIAIGASGQIFVSDGCRRVTVYAPNANGVAPPIGVIAERNNGLNPLIANAINAGVALDRDGNVYVLSGEGYSNPGPEPTKIRVFRPGTYGNAAPIRTISGPDIAMSGYPVGIAVDSKGQIYVATASTGDTGGSDSVLVFAPGSDGDAAPIAVIGGSKNTGLVAVDSMAVDSTGNIYVASELTCYYFCPESPHISVYAPGSNGDVAPTATISGPHTGLGFIGRMAVGPDGNLYVVTDRLTANPPDDASNSIVEVFPPGSHGDVAPIAEFPLPAGGAIAFGPGGKLYVVSYDPRNVTVYAPGGGVGDFKPIARIADRPSYINAPSGIAVGPGGLYLSNSYNPYNVHGQPGGCGSVVGYPARSLGRGPAAVTIAGLRTQVNCPHAIALDGGGDVYVADNDGIKVSGGSYSLAVDSHRNIYTSIIAIEGIAIYGASGNWAGIGTISGPNTGLFTPRALALDRAGNLYVAQDGHPESTISEFQAGSVGNVAPIAVISVSNPSGLGVDDQGKLYVLDDTDDTITVYPAGSNGNATPIATITGPKTGLAGPTGIAFGP